MVDGSGKVKLDNETPIMTQFGVSTDAYDAAYKRFRLAEDAASIARAGWRKAERDLDHARSEMETACRNCHEELLQKVKAAAA